MWETPPVEDNATLINLAGILPFFAQLARRGQEIPLYEDGLIVRDFVHVDDVVRALVLALEVNHPGATQVHVDIGSGVPTTISQVAGLIAARYSAPEPRVTGQSRDGDVRYACADPSAVGRALGWAPEMSLTDGIDELCEWVYQASDRL